jgi:ATP-dependent helicase HrpB
MAARRVAEELGENVGETVGYQVRFEEVAGPNTRLRFLTEGVLTRRLLTDPQLEGIDVVILDEFHERHLESDVALALLRRLQSSTRPDLSIAVMSATLSVGPLAAYLDCQAIRSEGRQFDINISYAGHSGAALEQQVEAAVARCVSQGIDGDLLVFLPGAAEIRRAMRACEGVARSAGLTMLPLHGDLSPEEQDRAVQPAIRPKLILSTNVAESSITIDGVTVVIDSGLARIATDNPATGLPTLEIRRISKASATQRAGRAGRTRPGRAIRLYSVDDFVRRPDHDLPEIHRRELSQILLELRAMGVEDVPWLEAPPDGAWRAAGELLERLGARENARAMARYPLHPRLARVAVEAQRRSVGEEACRIAALLSAGDRHETVDLLHAAAGPLSRKAEQTERQIRRVLRPRPDTGTEDDLRIAVLTGYPDRVARRQSARGGQLCNGRPVQFASDWASDLLVAVDVEERRDAGAPIVRLACSIRPEWLLDLFPERVSERNEVTWNRTAERVEAVSALLYEEIPIEETRGAAPDPEAAAGLLAARALDAGLHRITDPEALEAFLARVAFAAEHSDLRPLSQEDVRSAVEDLCHNLRSLAELEQAASGEGLIEQLKMRLGPGNERVLNDVAPERIALRSRQVRVNYVRGQPPWIASRLQDFFGMQETPRVARGRVPMVVHLLAPNHRPVQMTTDLAGFWERLYPQIRRELCRRYPKHSWPEKP